MDLKWKLDLNSLLSQKDKIKKVFFYRICGTGMGAAACLLKERGYQVEGGDQRFYPPMSDYLKNTGIPLHRLDMLDKQYLKKFDLIVVGNVVGRNTPGAAQIESLGVPFASFPATLGALVLKDFNVIGVAGTHGKTTTTYLFSQVFKKLGEKPGHLVGGVLPDRPPALLGDGKYFFIESDEYDSAYFEKISKFRMYCLDHLILTSLEYDHADIFPDVEAIKNEFRAALPEISKSFIFNQDYTASRELYEEFKNKVSGRWYFYGENQQEGPKYLEMNDHGSVFLLKWQGQELKFSTNLIGTHNILNLSAVIIFALQENFSPEQIQKAIISLVMAKRRQEVRGHFRGGLVIDDFAHHPRAVKATIDSIKVQYPDKKILVVLEPNSATARSDVFQHEFALSLLNVDQVVLAKPERPTTAPGRKDLDLFKLAEDIKSHGRDAIVIDNLPALQQHLESKADPQTIFLILSNGTCLGLWESNFVGQLK